MTVVIPIRLTADEVAKLNVLAYESETGAEGRGDFVRLLLHREWNRRHGLPKREVYNAVVGTTSAK